MRNPTIVDTRQAVASGHIRYFAIGIATYKYPAPTRQLGLAAPLKFRHKCCEHPKKDLERKQPKSKLS